MKFKDLFNTYFKYEPQNNYQFTMPDSQSSQPDIILPKSNEKININSNLKANLEYIKTMYNTMINSDIVIRQFTINARKKQYDAFIIYIDGMSDTKMMDNFVLKPLMLRNRNNLFDGNQNKVVAESEPNKITVRKIKKFDLSNYLMGCLMPQNDIKEVSTFDEVASRS